LLDHHVGWPADDQEMLNVVAANKDEAPSAVDGCLVDDSEPRLASARSAAAEASAREPAHHPERQREQGEHHDHDQNDFEADLSFAE
jgi:hypothetical protein